METKTVSDSLVMPKAITRPTLGSGGRAIRWLLLKAIWAYRKVLSPVLPASCRFQPSCSEYAAMAIATWGPAKGSWLAVKRIGRCHPFNAGGIDPVPRPPTINHRSRRGNS